jgi:hypothetical protein
MKGPGGSAELDCGSEHLEVMKDLFKQLIDNNIQKHVQEIENRKKKFLDRFKAAIIRKMTMKSVAMAKSILGNKEMEKKRKPTYDPKKHK